MKQFVLLAFTFFFYFLSNATIYTVNNYPPVGNPAPFTKIQDAVTAANTGDSIYISGSVNAYTDNVNINKRLVLLGPGMKPSNAISTSKYKVKLNDGIHNFSTTINKIK